MPKTIISDTSCFIVLFKIGELDLLQLTYGTIITTFEVASEFGMPLPDWVSIQSPLNKQEQSRLEIELDKGEASAIALALETPESIVILDDYKARVVAHKLGIEYTGTVGVIIRAKINGVIPSIKPVFEKIRSTDFRLTKQLEEKALKEAGENF